VLVIRQSLDDDSKQAVVALHGEGMIHIAYRPAKGARVKDMEYRVGSRGDLPGGKSPDSLVTANAKRIGIEKRGDELRAYFRAIIRSFWFMRDVKNFEYLRDLEKKLRRSNTHNQDERGVVAIVTAPDRLESWALPIDGGIAPETVQRIADDMVKSGKLSRPISAKDILWDDAVKQAYREVSGRAELKVSFEIALAAQEKYGF